MTTLLKGRYEIIQTLGAGGFGETFLAVDTHLPSKRKCVIKHFKPKQQLDPATFQLVRERFEREAAVLESLSESCNQIPRLYAYFVEEDEYYLVQELIEGQTIKQKVAAEGRFNEESIRQLLTSILPVLDHLHNKGVIHRDIKPDNIILRRRDGLPVLIDFGAVKEIVTTVIDMFGTPASPSITIGTSGYMPSEQAAGRPVFASDLYSLAMTAIFAATGKDPVRLSDLATGQIKWEDEVNDVSEQLQAILNKSIQPDYRHRYATAQMMTNTTLSLSYFEKGKSRYDQGDYEGAIADLNESVKLNPEYAKAYNVRGLAYHSKGDYDQAIADYNKAIELKPDDDAIYHNRANTYRSKSDYDSAIADHSKAIGNNKQARAYYRKVIDNNNQVIADCRKALELISERRELREKQKAKR